MKNPTQSSWPLIILIGLTALAFVGCKTRTYTQGGESEAPDRSRLIKVTCDSKVTITSLDGEKLTSIATDYFLNGPLVRAGGVDVAYVKPGRHELGLHWKHGDIYADHGEWFIAEIGKEYTVRCQDNDDAKFLRLGSVKFWVEEVGTENHVGGRLIKR